MHGADVVMEKANERPNISLKKQENYFSKNIGLKRHYFGLKSFSEMKNTSGSYKSENHGENPESEMSETLIELATKIEYYCSLITN